MEAMRKYYELAKAANCPTAASMIAKWSTGVKTAEQPTEPLHAIPKIAEDTYKGINEYLITKMAGSDKDTIMARIEEVGSNLDSIDPESKLDLEKIKTLIDEGKV